MDQEINTQMILVNDHSTICANQILEIGKNHNDSTEYVVPLIDLTYTYAVYTVSTRRYMMQVNHTVNNTTVTIVVDNYATALLTVGYHYGRIYATQLIDQDILVVRINDITVAFDVL